MNAEIKQELEQYLLEKISQAECNFNSDAVERYQKAYEEIHATIGED